MDHSGAIPPVHIAQSAATDAWKTSNVTNMTVLFWGASAFNQDIGGWNVSNVTTMDGMFEGASSFNGGIGAWNTGNVTTMSRMFSNATSFNRNLSGWCVSLISAKPGGFDENATTWTLPWPGWGTCPPPTPPFETWGLTMPAAPTALCWPQGDGCPPSVLLRADATGTSGVFANPWALVRFYYRADGASSPTLIGEATAPSVTDDGVNAGRKSDTSGGRKSDTLPGVTSLSSS
jgi:surface protein